MKPSRKASMDRGCVYIGLMDSTVVCHIGVIGKAQYGSTKPSSTSTTKSLPKPANELQTAAQRVRRIAWSLASAAPVASQSRTTKSKEPSSTSRQASADPTDDLPVRNEPGPERLEPRRHTELLRPPERPRRGRSTPPQRHRGIQLGPSMTSEPDPSPTGPRCRCIPVASGCIRAAELKPGSIDSREPSEL